MREPIIDVIQVAGVTIDLAELRRYIEWCRANGEEDVILAISLADQFEDGVQIAEKDTSVIIFREDGV